MTAPAVAAPAAAQPAEAQASTAARSPRAQPSERAPVLESVPRPPEGATVASLGGAVAGGLEAVQAEWGLEGGEVILTGRRPFLDVTGHAAFRSDGTLSGDVRMRANLQLLGIPLGTAEWAVAGWSPDAPLATPAVQLRGTTLHVDLTSIPPEAAFTPAASIGASRSESTVTVSLPGDAVPEGEPLSPRYAEVFRGLLGADVSGLKVHPDSPVADAPAFVTNTDLFFAAGIYGIDSPQTLEILDAAVRAALAGIFGPIGADAPPQEAPPPPAGAAARPTPSSEVINADVPPPVGDAAASAVAEATTETAAQGGTADSAPNDAASGAAPAEDLAPPAGGGGGGGGGVENVVLEEAPTEPSEATAARGGAVAGGAGGAASAAATLPSADANASDARGAVAEPAAETVARAQEAMATELGERPPPSPEIVALAQRIRDAIASRRPESEDELLRSDPTAEANAAGATITGSVETQSQEVSGAYDEMGNPPAGSPALSPTPVATPETSTPGMGVDASTAAPEPLPPEATSLDGDTAAMDARIEESGLETRVTAEIPDGPFGAARAARGEAGELAQQAPEEIRAQEQAAIDSAAVDMANLQMQAMAALRASREGTIGAVGGEQSTMTGTEEVTRDNVSQRAQGIYDAAQQQVNGMLEPLSRTALAQWDAGLARLSREFHDCLDSVQRWIDDRHSGVVGGIIAVGDYVFGYPDWIIREYDRAETRFGDGVSDLLLTISSDVNAVVAAAQGIIANARTQINGLFDQMEAEFPEFAAQERARFQGMLDGLSARVTDAQTSFVRDVSARAITAVNEAHAAVEEARQRAGGLWGQLLKALQEFIDDPVKAIINGLLRLVGIPPGSFWALIAQIEQVASDIAENPENFINNLTAGVKMGFQQFFDNFGTHLLGAFWRWLFSGLRTPIPMPTSFDPMSLVSFALQLMGITWPNIREILVRHLGPEAVELLEIAWQILSTLIAQGPQGLVNMIKDMLSPESVVGMILDAAIEYIVEKLIVKAAEYVFSLLNPAGAVAQAIMLIYRVCSWIFRNAARIFAFVQAVVGGMANVIAGNISGLAGVVERALASMLVVVIDLFMGLLGLGDLPDEVAGVIQRLQAYVLGIIDRIVGFLVTQARALLRRIGIGGDEDDEDAENDNDDDELGTTVRFSGGGESHRLWIDVSGDDATLMVASTPGPVENKLAEWRQRFNAGEPDDPQKYAEAAGALSAAEGLTSEANTEADALAAQFLQAQADEHDDIEPPSDDALENRERALATAIGRLYDIFEGGDKTEQWLREMSEYLPGRAEPAMDPPYRDWALRIPEFTIGNQPDDERIWGVGVLDGTRDGAVTYIASESTHRLFLPYFQADSRNRRVKTAAFSDYVFTGGGPVSARTAFRRGYGDAAVQRLKTAATWTVRPSTRVDDVYKDRLLARIDRMRFEPGAPGGGRIEFPTERIPDHTRYRPLSITTTESGGVRTITYNTVTGQTFTSTTDSNAGLSISVTGENLRFMTGRGVTQDSPGFTANNGFDRSHIIANEFGGSGYAAGGNLITASSEYNQTHMRGAERQVGDAIAAFAASHGLEVTEVSFTMTVRVSFGALRDPAALAQAKAALDAAGIRPGADLDAEITQKINSGQVHPDLMRVTGIVYTWTFTDPAGGTSSLSIGADLWLLTQG